jgi:hypothetical protein
VTARQYARIVHGWIEGLCPLRFLARLRALRSDLIDPTIALHQRHGRCSWNEEIEGRFGRSAVRKAGKE